MSEKLNKFYDLIEKIGKPNFILVVFILIIIIITGIYQTFSLYTESAGMSIIDGLRTYKFIVNNSNDTNSVTVPNNSSKHLAITVSNPEDVDLKYGIYYSSLSDLTEVSLGYLKNSEYKASGIIENNKDYIVTIKIENNSDDNVTIDFGLSYGLEKGGDLTLDNNQSWVTEKFEPYKLNKVKPGSYVEYLGNNNCEGDYCRGQNANFLDEEDMGYCYDIDYKYQTTGWRVAYIKDNNVYLVSAASPECTSASKLDELESENAIDEYINLLNKEAQKYCNYEYAAGGKCDITSTWAMNINDVKNILNNEYNPEICYNSPDSELCGTNNDLIANGGYYWYANKDSINQDMLFYFDPSKNILSSNYKENELGLRIVIKLEETVTVTAGVGTKEQPYKIINNTNLNN